MTDKELISHAISCFNPYKEKYASTVTQIEQDLCYIAGRLPEFQDNGFQLKKIGLGMGVDGAGISVWVVKDGDHAIIYSNFLSGKTDSDGRYLEFGINTLLKAEYVDDRFMISGWQARLLQSQLKSQLPEFGI